MFVGIICIFADIKCDKEYKKGNNYVDPFPPGTEKVPYIKQEITSNNITTEQSNTEDNDRRDTNSACLEKENTIEIKNKEEATQEYNKSKEVVVNSNPYDIPDDF